MPTVTTAIQRAAAPTPATSIAAPRSIITAASHTRDVKRLLPRVQRLLPWLDGLEKLSPLRSGGGCCRLVRSAVPALGSSHRKIVGQAGGARLDRRGLTKHGLTSTGHDRLVRHNN